MLNCSQLGNDILRIYDTARYVNYSNGISDAVCNYGIWVTWVGGGCVFGEGALECFERALQQQPQQQANAAIKGRSLQLSPVADAKEPTTTAIDSSSGGQ